MTTALIAGGATVLAALITSLIALAKSRKTEKAALSLDDLLEAKNIDNMIAAIQDRRHFVSEGHILGTLMMEYEHPDAWAQFRRLILDESLVSQMIEKSEIAQKGELVSGRRSNVRFEIDVFNPSDYARGGPVTAPWQPIQRATGIGANAFQLLDGNGRGISAQIDRIDPADPSLDTLVFSLRNGVS